jgi:hypothetical protein
MDFSLSADRQRILDAIRKLCAQFDNGCWLAKDERGELPARTAHGASSYVALPHAIAVLCRLLRRLRTWTANGLPSDRSLVEFAGFLLERNAINSGNRVRSHRYCIFC